MKKVLITGGVGYIGSHTVIEFCNKGYEVIILDNLSNSLECILNSIEKLCNQNIKFYKIDLCDFAKTEEVFAKEKNIVLVIHFAAYKSVNEATYFPLKYFNNNLISLLNLLCIMEKYNCQYIVFSSSCTVYGETKKLPVLETSPFEKALTAYGSSKQMCEDILEKTSTTKKIKCISLRYFNPVGAHPSGLIGELNLNKPSNVMPLITQTASGKQKAFYVFGNDYHTKDGTCIRDYIHVVDLAISHLMAAQRMLSQLDTDFYEVFNIGSGTGYSVLELINTFETENKIKLNYSITNRREGDVTAIYADTTKATQVLKWKPTLSIKNMVKDAWQWEKNIDHIVKK